MANNRTKYNPFSWLNFKIEAKGLYGREVTKKAAAKVVTTTEKAGRLWINGSFGERNI